MLRLLLHAGVHLMELFRSIRGARHWTAQLDACAVLGTRFTFFDTALHRAPDGPTKVGIAVIAGVDCADLDYDQLHTRSVPLLRSLCGWRYTLTATIFSRTM